MNKFKLFFTLKIIVIKFEKPFTSFRYTYRSTKLQFTGPLSKKSDKKQDGKKLIQPQFQLTA